MSIRNLFESKIKYYTLTFYNEDGESEIDIQVAGKDAAREQIQHEWENDDYDSMTIDEMKPNEAKRYKQGWYLDLDRNEQYSFAELPKS